MEGDARHFLEGKPIVGFGRTQRQVLPQATRHLPTKQEVCAPARANREGEIGCN
jgi:hypothetical protein